MYGILPPNTTRDHQSRKRASCAARPSGLLSTASTQVACLSVSLVCDFIKGLTTISSKARCKPCCRSALPLERLDNGRCRRQQAQQATIRDEAGKVALLVRTTSPIVCPTCKLGQSACQPSPNLAGPDQQKWSLRSLAALLQVHMQRGEASSRRTSNSCGGSPAGLQQAPPLGGDEAARWRQRRPPSSVFQTSCHLRHQT